MNSSKAPEHKAGWFNLGGPGWFSDVLTLDLSLHTDRVTMAADGVFGLVDEYKLFLAHETLNGTVTVVPPPRCSIWAKEIEVRLVGTISFLESLRDVELCSVPVKVGGAQYISEAQSLDFSIPLDQLSLMDSYDGEACSVRYEVVVTVDRPWYTFAVIDCEPIQIENVEGAVNAMKEMAGAAATAAAAGGEAKAGGGEAKDTDDDSVAVAGGVLAKAAAAADEKPMEPLGIDDFGGVCRFDYKKTHYHLGETIEGSVDLQSVGTPVHKISLVVLRIELAEGDLSEMPIGEQVIFDATKDKLDVAAAAAGGGDGGDGEAKVAGGAAVGGDDHGEDGEDQPPAVGGPTVAKAKEPITSPCAVSFELPLSECEVTPDYTFRLLADKTDPDIDDDTPGFSVSYFLRCILYTAQVGDEEEEEEEEEAEDAMIV